MAWYLSTALGVFLGNLIGSRFIVKRSWRDSLSVALIATILIIPISMGLHAVLD